MSSNTNNNITDTDIPVDNGPTSQGPQGEPGIAGKNGADAPPEILIYVSIILLLITLLSLYIAYQANSKGKKNEEEIDKLKEQIATQKQELKNKINELPEKDQNKMNELEKKIDELIENDQNKINELEKKIDELIEKDQNKINELEKSGKQLTKKIEKISLSQDQMNQIAESQEQQVLR